jgi:sulfur relay (sulfurtransferase) DsrC/TusE family protein
MNEYAVKVDTELFDLIALSHKYKGQGYRKAFTTRVAKFIVNTDHISSCLLVVVMPAELVSKLVETNWEIVPYIVKFTKTHSIPKVYKMLAARYGDELRRLELRMDAMQYAQIVELLS